MAPIGDVDEIIETEVCNRLIRLSCAKMVSSKTERGGAKLHRNLLILHLLRKARDEQKRFPVFTNEMEWMKEPTDDSGMISHLPKNTAAAPVNFTHYVEEFVTNDVEDEEMSDDEDVEEESEATHLLDLSKCHERLHSSSIDGSLVHEEQTEFDYSTLSLAPLQYTEIYAVDESTSAQQHMFGEYASLSGTYFLEQGISAQTVARKVERKEGDESGAPSTQELSCDPEYECLSNVNTVSVSKSTSEDEAGSSYSSDDEEDNEAKIERGITENELSANSSRRRRKRKTSTHCLLSPCSAKKCCVEEHQLTGLISVFNSGLTVVADQFLARPASSTVSALQQTPKQISSFMHITCNPLIC